ncbi:MAG TPA: serine/threonine-protein kinase [Candidatus Thermoplasmatota archaeon]|nr:serine/threonine-protein kinase [Candidatus Thermoplasmatota archaeon]
MEPATLLNVVSGVMLAALGAALLGTQRRTPGRFFGAFAAVLGVQVVLSNLAASAADERTASILYGLSIAFIVPQYVFILYFASVFPRATGPLAMRRAALAPFLAPAVAAVLLVIFAYPLLLAGAFGGPTGYSAQWGPLAPWLLHVPQFGALVAALFLLERSLRGGDLVPIERDQARLVLAGLGAYVAYATARNLAEALARYSVLEQALGPITLAAYVGLFAVGALVVGVVTVRLLRDPVGSPWLAAWLGVPAIVGLGSVAPILAGLPLVDSAGLWRLAGLAIVAYAIVKYQLFDLELRLRRAVGPAAGLAAAGLVGAASVAAGPTVAATASVGAGLIAGGAAHGAARRWLRAEEPTSIERRKFEVYQASAIQAVRESSLQTPETRAWLSSLQDSMGLTRRDCEVLESLARSQADPSASGGLEDLPPRYRVVRMLGRGAFGRVFLARDEKAGRDVVLKQLHPAWSASEVMRESFLQEGQAPAAVDHPGVVQVHDVLETPHSLFLVTEYVEGDNLERLVGSRGPLPPERVAEICGGILDALAAVHAAGVLHRDLKPANVVLDARGMPRIVDFGIAFVPGARTSLAAMGLLPGTPAYMSPEQAAGGATDVRSDLYGVAAIAYFLLAARPYLELRGLDPGEMRRRVMEEPPRLPLPGVPPEMNAWLEKGLRKDPRLRFQSAGEMAHALPLTVPTGRGPHVPTVPTTEATP